MTQEEQRVAIAEACGFKRGSFGKWNGRLQGTLVCDAECNDCDVPDYPNDLNAMHEAGKSLKKNERRLYEIALAELCSGNRPVDHCGSWTMCAPQALAKAIDANAAQRAEAFLRTIGKWKE